VTRPRLCPTGVVAAPEPNGAQARDAPGEGKLNVCGTEAGAGNAEPEKIGRLVATHAGVAFGGAAQQWAGWRVPDLGDDVDTATPMGSRVFTVTAARVGPDIRLERIDDPQSECRAATSAGGVGPSQGPGAAMRCCWSLPGAAHPGRRGPRPCRGGL